MSEKTILTRSGYAQFMNELELLRGEKMHDIAEQIRTARAFGDLSENAEYIEAKNEQGRLQARIMELEKLLKTVDIIDDGEGAGATIRLGSNVRLHDDEFDEELNYKIVGSAEAAPFNGLISNESPVGKGLLGHSVGDVVEIEAPNGVMRFTILDIS